jgi:hypothetical protein
MAPALDKKTRLKVGDEVSVRVGVFGQEYARTRVDGRTPWTTETVRDDGEVTGRDGEKWVVTCSDISIKLKRNEIAFISRPQQEPGAARATAVEQQDSSQDDEENPVGMPPLYESDSDDEAPIGAPDHREGGEGVGGFQAVSEWARDDECGTDERAKHGFTDQNGPRLTLAGWETASLFALALHFLPMVFIAAMAAAMQARGRAKAKETGPEKRWAKWTVTSNDVLQWIGVWLYMLAFPQPGERRAYFQESPGGFGPRHRLADYLKLGRNGKKGLLWFEDMHVCFGLPEYPNSEGDPFRKTRRWWDALRDGFFSAVTCSWLMLLDESMVRWMGVGMPGLMGARARLESCACVQCVLFEKRAAKTQ